MWLGENFFILKGATIGDGSIVAVGSVITKVVPKAVIVEGNPDKKVKKEWHIEYGGNSF